MLPLPALSDKSVVLRRCPVRLYVQMDRKTGHDSPLPQLEVVSAGFQATRPDFILRGLRHRKYFVDCLQRDGHFIGFGKRWLRLPPLVESDRINLMFSGGNQECRWKIHGENSWPPRNMKLLSVYGRQFKGNRLITPAVPVFPNGLWLR